MIHLPVAGGQRLLESFSDAKEAEKRRFHDWDADWRDSLLRKVRFLKPSRRFWG
jgi:hypothetical protein